MIYISRQPGLFNSELYHHGIKGMRWGIRRYQNPDGSLTEAGKKRYLADKHTRYNLNKHLLNDMGKDILARPKEFVDRWDRSLSELGIKVEDIVKYKANTPYKDIPENVRDALDSIRYESASGVKYDKTINKKASEYAKQVNDIFRSMNDEDQDWLTDIYSIGTDTLLSEGAAREAVENGSAFIEKYKGVPVSFLYTQSDLWRNSSIVIGTHPNYRGKGYARKNVEKVKNWLDNNEYNKSTLEWVAYKGNVASRSLAKRSGFKAHESNKYATKEFDDTLYTYTKRLSS